MTDDGSATGASKPPKSRRGGLGRGLDSLIPTTAPAELPVSPVTDGSIRELSIDDIEPNPYQPRTSLDRQRLEELAGSIARHGLLQPLVVTRNRSGDGWVLIAGERRWRAARLAGLTRVTAVVIDAAPREMLELAIVENVVRADLVPLEEAAAFNRLVNEFGLSQTEVAERVGRSRASIANTLRLLGAADRVQEALSNGDITEGHARALLGLPSLADQPAALDIVLERGLNVRQTEALVRSWDEKIGQAPPQVTERDSDEIRIEDRLRSALGTRVSLRKGAGSKAGALTIHFFSDEQLQGIYDRLVGEDLW